MKTHSILAILIIASIVNAESDSIRSKLSHSDAPIQNVTVFTGRAEVTRKITRNLTKGKHEFVFRLPDGILSESIRISGISGKVVMTDLTSEFKTENEAPSSQNKERIEVLKKKLKEIEQDITLLQNEREWWKGYSNSFLKPKVDVPANFETISNYWDFSLNRLKHINEKLNALEDSKKEANEELNGLSAKDLQSVQKMDYFTEAVVFLDVLQDSEVEFTLSYVTQRAGWFPSYDVRADSNSDEVEVTYFGNIKNWSGEDWDNVNIILSTAKPGLRGAPPTFGTRIVQRKVTQDHFPFQKRASNNANIQNMVYGGAMYESQDTSDLFIFDTQVEEGMTSATYTIPRKYSFKTDNKPHRVVILVSRSKSKFTYEAVPRLQAEAFLKASVKNENPGPYLPGTMNVFLDGNFITKSEMKEVSTGEDFTIFLGSDAGIKVEYRSFGDYKDQSGLFTKSNYVTSKSKIVIKNYKKNPISIAVYEQLPMSSEKGITVTLHSPAPESFTPGEFGVRLTESNNIRWYKTIPPKGTEEFRNHV